MAAAVMIITWPEEDLDMWCLVTVGARSVPSRRPGASLGLE